MGSAGRVAGGAGIALAVLLLAAVGLTAYQWATETGKGASLPLALRPFPISIEPEPRPCMVVPEEDMSRIRAQVEPLDEGMTTSLYLHALRVFGPDWEYRRGKLGFSGDTLRLFADEGFSRDILGTALMVRTPYGIRSTPEDEGRARESHRDFCLAMLSEQRVPAAFSMIVDGQPFTLGDFLADSVANFHLGQEEIEWTALAYAAWIPPEREWTNKFGETFSFDDLATELTGRPLNEAVCAGSHLVQAMIVLGRADAEVCSILSPGVRGKVHDRLRAIVREAEATQAPDGSWGPDWFDGLLQDADREPNGERWSSDSGSLSKRLLATSHIPEWMMLLPRDLRVSDERLRRAGRWLHAQLKDVDSQFVRENFCPCTHGAVVLQMLRDQAGEPAVDQVRLADPLSVHDQGESQ